MGNCIPGGRLMHRTGSARISDPVIHPSDELIGTYMSYDDLTITSLQESEIIRAINDSVFIRSQISASNTTLVPGIISRLQATHAVQQHQQKQQQQHQPQQQQRQLSTFKSNLGESPATEDTVLVKTSVKSRIKVKFGQMRPNKSKIKNHQCRLRESRSSLLPKSDSIPEIILTTPGGSWHPVPSDSTVLEEICDVTHYASSGDLCVPDVTLGRFLLEKFDQFGDIPAIINNLTNEYYTYGQLAAMSRSMACALSKRNFQPGHVLCCVTNNAMLLAVLTTSVTCVGGTLSILDPIYGLETLVRKFHETKTRIVVTEDQVAELVYRAALKAKTIHDVYISGNLFGMQSVRELLRESSEDFQHFAPSDPSSTAALILYSSTTFAAPQRGVSHSHHAILASIHQITSRLPASCGRWVVTEGVSLVHWLWLTTSLYSGLSSGQTLVTGPEIRGQRLVCQSASLHIQGENFEEWYDEFTNADLDWSKLTSVFCGQTPISAMLQRHLAERNITVHTAYGRPECLVTHCGRCDGQTDVRGALLSGTECRIVACDTLDPLPVGSEGEIWVRGPQLMMGYVDSKLASPVNEDGWLKTKDVGTMDVSGVLHMHPDDMDATGSCAIETITKPSMSAYCSRV